MRAFSQISRRRQLFKMLATKAPTEIAMLSSRSLLLRSPSAYELSRPVLAAF